VDYLISWVTQRSRRSENCPGGNLCPLDAISSENVEYCFAGCEQVVCDDPPMTSPPNSLRTHDCTTVLTRSRSKPPGEAYASIPRETYNTAPDIIRVGW
jgi:hypothetical protein